MFLLRLKLSLKYLKIKDRRSLGVEHIFELKQKSKNQIKDETKTEGSKGKVNEEKSDVFSTHSQFICKAGRDIKSMSFKKVPYVVH